MRRLTRKPAPNKTQQLLERPDLTQVGRNRVWGSRVRLSRVRLRRFRGGCGALPPRDSPPRAPPFPAVSRRAPPQPPRRARDPAPSTAPRISTGPRACQSSRPRCLRKWSHAAVGLGRRSLVEVANRKVAGSSPAPVAPAASPGDLRRRYRVVV